jgi:hypothetical protein
MARGSTNVPPPAMDLGLKPADRNQLALFAKAMAGDMVLVVTPATDTPAPTSAAWTQDFYIELQTAAGEVHTWFNKTVTSGVSVGDTSTAGTASISPAANNVFVDGVSKVTMSGDAQAWLNTETATLTVAQLVLLGYTLAQKTGVLTFTTP